MQGLVRRHTAWLPTLGFGRAAMISLCLWLADAPALVLHADGSVPGEWPTRVSSGHIPVEAVREDPAAGVFIYRTPHFEFSSDVRMSINAVAEFGRAFEATLEAMRQMPLKWNPRPPPDRELFSARIFSEQDAYFAHGAPANSGGVYYHAKGEMHVPATSLGIRRGSTTLMPDRSGDMATLVHEITHQVQHDWLVSLPLWLIEGMAVYMESIPYRRGEFRFDRRDPRAFAASRYPAIREYPMLNINEVMDATHQSWLNTLQMDPLKSRHFYFSSYLLTYYFLHMDGDGRSAALYRYLRAIEQGQNPAEAEKILLQGRTRSDLAEDIKRAFRRERVTIQALN